MKPTPRHLLLACFASMQVAVFACGATTASSTTTESSPVVSGSAVATPTPTSTGKLDPAVSMPNGFPSDFPVYPGARLTAANQVTANGQSTWGVQWETLDSVDQVQSFYTNKLNQGDWTLSYNGTSNGVFSAIFNRKSNQKDAGIVGAELVSDVTHITLAFGMAG